MILGGFLALCAAGAVLGLALRAPARVSLVTGLAFLAAAAAAAAAMGSGGELTLGGVQLSATPFASSFLALTVASCLLLCLVGATTQPPAALAPAALAAFGGFGVAMTSSDPRVALIAGAAAATTGTLTLLHHPAAEARDGRIAELRILGIVAGALLLAAVVALRPPWNGHEDRAIGVAFVALLLAVAVRAGTVPFHVPAAHMSRNATPTATALLLVWLPAALATLALTWSPLAFTLDSAWVDGAVGCVQAVAVATILLGGLAALVHDQLEEVTAYSIVSDAGFLLLALAARVEVAAEPARLWLLVFVATKTALVAWSAATARVFGSSGIASLRGWLRRTPLLGLGLVAIAVATLGWPGSDVAGARSELIHLGLPSGLGWVGPAAVVIAIGYYGRLLVVGILPPGAAARDSWSERPRLGFAWRHSGAPQSEPAGEPIAAAVVAPVIAGATSPAMETEAPPKRKRRTRAAAAAVEPMPSVAAEPPATPPATAPASAGSESTPTSEDAAGPAAQPTDTEPSAPTAELETARPRRRGPSIGHRLGLIWRLNRTLEVSLVVLAAAALALAAASGSFGLADAARDGIPMGTAAHATVSPTPVASLPPTQAPLATGTPIPSTSPSPSATAVPSGPPASASPTNTSPAQPTPIIK